MTLIKVFQEEFLEIAFDSQNRWLYADWKGYQTEQSIKAGIDALIRQLPEYGVHKILNDNTHTLGIWLSVANWLVFDALPRARAAGLKHFAHVHGPSRFSRISAEAALLLLRPAAQDIKAFDGLEPAMEWLNSHAE
jgi:hypothetical protein